MTPIIMPQVGQDIPVGKIVQWLKDEGDPVEAGEVVLVVESEKASFEVEAEESGTLLKILHRQDEEVEILKPVGYIGQAGESVDQAAVAAEPQAEATPAPKAVSQQPAADQRPVAEGKKVIASPAAKRLARQKGVDLSTVSGSGPGGRITTQDVEAAATGQAQPTAAPAASDEDTVEPFAKMRKRIAERLTASKRDIPHFYLMVDVDMTDALAWRKSFNADSAAHVTVTDLIIKAAAEALKSFSRLNAHVTGDSIIIKKDINIGVAVAVADGLLVPVIPNTDRLSLPEISAAATKNADDARRGMMKPEPVGTFTVTSLGMHSVSKFVPIINPPECAILAAGSAEPRVVALDGAPAVRQVMTLTLACDHRAVDGADAAGLLNEIKRILATAADLAGQWT